MRKALIPVAGVLWLAGSCLATPAGYTLTPMDPNTYRNWVSRWQSSIVGDERNRYCDSAMGEDVAWLMQPFLNGFYYGYEATHDPNWIRMEANWADSWIKRKLIEPDGYPGWPKLGAAGTDVDKLNSYYADSMLGDAMALAPIVLTAGEILRTPSLNAVYGAKARSYLDLSVQIYNKWVSRGGFRDTAGGGAISIVQPWGIDANTWTWTGKYVLRNDPNWGFSHPDNKANEVAMWLLAMYDATGDANFRNQASKWYTLMKSRMKLEPNGVYDVWNYWQPAGNWDYDPNGHRNKHWIGVHPNNGYYQIDTTSIVAAYEHGVVFTLSDIQGLVKTDLSLLAGDGNLIWPALAPYSPEIQRRFEASFQPDSWGGHGLAPQYLYFENQVPEPACAAALALGAAAILRRRRRR